MKCMFYISMYSGAMPPECELKPEQIEKINELVAELRIQHENKGRVPPWGIGPLSPTTYGVFWLPEEITPEMFATPFEGPWMGFQCQYDGPVHVYRQEEDFRGIDLKDTVGLWEYLSIIGAKLYARHCRDAQEALDDYYEKVLGISSEEKV